VADNEKAGESLKEAMVAYRTRWEMVAKVEAEELRRSTLAESWQRLNWLAGMMSALGTFERAVEQNQLDAEAVRERWIRLKAGLP
jgi:hypothetical protein